MIYIVTGPPCGGKSTYIRNNAKDQDLIIDMDRIALALMPEGTEAFRYDDKVRKVAMMARKAAVTEALFQMQGERRRNLWIIHTDPSPEQRKAYKSFNGRIVEVNPGKEVCLQRLKARPKENHAIARKVIDDYFIGRNERVASTVVDPSPAD